MFAAPHFDAVVAGTAACPLTDFSISAHLGAMPSSTAFPFSAVFPFLPSTGPSLSPLSDPVTSQYAELTSLLVLFLWQKIPMKNLLGAWSASVGAAPPTSYLPSPANTATSFTSTSTSSSSIGFASQSATPASVTQFRAFVEQVLSTTKVSSAVIVLALKYLQRLSRNRHLISKSSVLITSPDSCRLALIVTLVLSNKYSDDERFTNAAWAGVAGIDVDVLNRAELEALDAIQWTLTVSEEEYTRWIEIVSTFASNTAAACELVERQKHQAKVQQEQQQLILAAARQDEHRQQSLQLRHAQPQQHSFRSRTAPLTPITVSSSSPLSVFPYPKPRSAPSEPSVTWVAPPSAAIYDRRGSASMFPPSQMVLGH